jgi:hypothetical protein
MHLECCVSAGGVATVALAIRSGGWVACSLSVLWWLCLSCLVFCLHMLLVVGQVVCAASYSAYIRPVQAGSPVP